MCLPLMMTLACPDALCRRYAGTRVELLDIVRLLSP
jgi:hypothetical protein